MPFDHFNFIAGFYNRVGEFSLSDKVLRLLDLSPSHNLLDAGGGTGRVAVALRKFVKQVYVLDTSMGMLLYAVRKGLASICAPVESLPFPSGSMDRIIMVDAFHHVINQAQTVRELWRVLSPGGRILIIEPDFNKFFVKLIALGEKMLLMRSHFLTGNEIVSLVGFPESKVDAYFQSYNVFVLIQKEPDDINPPRLHLP